MLAHDDTEIVSLLNVSVTHDTSSQGICWRANLPFSYSFYIWRVPRNLASDCVNDRLRGGYMPLGQKIGAYNRAPTELCPGLHSGRIVEAQWQFFGDFELCAHLVPRLSHKQTPYPGATLNCIDQLL
jgi:hypothetical protein